MGQVKTWQKVTIGILVAALIAVVASIITRNADANAANSQPSYAAEAETQTSDYYGELADETYVPETTKEQKAPALSEKKIADELFKDFEKHYGKAYQKNSANEFFNPYFECHGDGIQISPYHIWYQGNNMYADCWIVNMNSRTADNIYVDDFSISNNDGVLADANFGQLSRGSIEPGHYVSHRFIFQPGTFEKGDLTGLLHWNSHSSYDNI